PPGEREVDRARGLGRAGKGVARQQVQHLAGNPGREQAADRRRGGERRLLGRLGDDRIAGGERGGDLAGEDRQRKIPRRDAGEDAAAVQGEAVALAGRAGQVQRYGKIGAGAGGVVAQVVRRLAQLGKGGRQGPPAFADDQRHQRIAVAFVKLGGALEDRGAV